jgi:hypothetical protein
MTRTWRATLVAVITGAALANTFGAAVAPSIAEASSTGVSHTVRVACGRGNEPAELKTISTTGNTCWTGIGWAWVKLYQVSYVWTGNHRGYYRTSDDKMHPFTPWMTYKAGYATITEIVIDS